MSSRRSNAFHLQGVPGGLVAAAGAVARARVAIGPAVPVDPATLGVVRRPMGGRLLFRPPVLADVSPDDAEVFALFYSVLRRRENGESVEDIRPDLIIPAAHEATI